MSKRFLSNETIYGSIKTNSSNVVRLYLSNARSLPVPPVEPRSFDSTHRVIANISEQSPIQIDYTFPAATAVNAYRVKSNGHSDSSAGDRAPKSIKFFGSNDGIEWTELDARSHETGWVMNEERQFEFVNETAYTKYRMEFYACNNGHLLEFFKLEYRNTGRFGRLHVAVPSGTMTNSGVTLSGELRLVKEGEGTLVVAKTGQTYGGGTEIAGGDLRDAACRRKGRAHGCARIRNP